MPARPTRTSGSQGGAGPILAAPTGAPTGSTSPVDADQFGRWARLIAAGEAEIPNDWTTEQIDLLVTEVRRLRRLQLLGFVAQVIARDLHSDTSLLEDIQNDSSGI